MTGFTVKPGKTARAGARLLIPPAEVERVMREVGPLPGPTGLRKLAAIKAIVEGWCARARPRGARGSAARACGGAWSASAVSGPHGVVSSVAASRI